MCRNMAMVPSEIFLILNAATDTSMISKRNISSVQGGLTSRGDHVSAREMLRHVGGKCNGYWRMATVIVSSTATKLLGSYILAIF